MIMSMARTSENDMQAWDAEGLGSFRRCARQSNEDDVVGASPLCLHASHLARAECLLGGFNL